MSSTPVKPLRSAAWFDNPANIDMTALYLERYLNFGISLEELRSGRPVIGIAQTGSDLSPCNRHHLVLAERLRDGIREAGGVPIEFPVHPIQETGKRPTRPPGSTATWRSWRWSKCCSATRSTGSCSRSAATRPRPRV
jgi:dihydroxy-acid dehydratase